MLLRLATPRFTLWERRGLDFITQSSLDTATVWSAHPTSAMHFSRASNCTYHACFHGVKSFLLSLVAYALAFLKRTLASTLKAYCGLRKRSPANTVHLVTVPCRFSRLISGHTPNHGGLESHLAGGGSGHGAELRPAQSVAAGPRGQSASKSSHASVDHPVRCSIRSRLSRVGQNDRDCLPLSG